MYIYRDIFINTYIYAATKMSMYSTCITSVWAHVHTNMCARAPRYTHTYIARQICLHTYTYTYIYIYINVCISIYTYMCVYTHPHIPASMSTPAHTYTYKFLLSSIDAPFLGRPRRRQPLVRLVRRQFIRRDRV